MASLVADMQKRVPDSFPQYWQAISLARGQLPLATLVLLFCSSGAFAQGPANCAGMDEATRTRIIHTVARSAHTEPLLPTIVEEKLVPGTCYWQLSLTVSNATRRLTLYLSPDRRFVFSTLLDVSADPWTVEEQLSDRLKQEAEKDHAPVRGPEALPVSVVVFSDFQCSYCATFSEMVERYRKDNPDRIRVTFRNLPLPVHDWAAYAARAGVCIAHDDKNSSAFWKFHDLLFARQKSMTTENLSATITSFISNAPGLQPASYSKCMDSTFPQSRLEQDLAEATSLGIDATPTIFINGRKYSGFRDDTSFALAINLATPTELPQRESTPKAKN